MKTKMQFPVGRHVKDPVEDRILYTIVYLILGLFTLIVLLPLIHILASSFSSGVAVSTGRVLLWPVDFSLVGYQTVFGHRLILSAYRNTIFYTVAGTLINLAVTLTCAYPLSRKDMPFRRGFMMVFLITMFFSGGLIPTYMIMADINFIDTVWAMLIPGALSVYNMILVRTYFSNSIPNELLEASQNDGCSDMRYFFNIMLPLAKPIVAVVTLYYAVAHWNAYFNGMMYLNNQQLYPLQLVLRQILIANQIDLQDLDIESMIARQGLADLLKYSLIVVSTAPIMCVYPFIQRYFIKGMMIGSVKG